MFAYVSFVVIFRCDSKRRSSRLPHERATLYVNTETCLVYAKVPTCRLIRCFCQALLYNVGMASSRTKLRYTGCIPEPRAHAQLRSNLGVLAFSSTTRSRAGPERRDELVFPLQEARVAADPALKLAPPVLEGFERHHLDGACRSAEGRQEVEGVADDALRQRHCVDLRLLRALRRDARPAARRLQGAAVGGLLGPRI